MIYEPNYEQMEKNDLKQLQIEKLQTTLNRVYRNVSFYKQSFDNNNVNIENIKTISDLKNLPFTTKDDLRKSYPYNMFAVPLKDIVRIHSSSGTTGKPIVVGYTKNDIRNWSICVSRLLTAAEITDHDFVQIAFDYSLFTGGFGFHYGAERIGASVIPSSSSGNFKKQVLIMKDYKTSVLLSTPGYAINIAKALDEMNIHPDELSLKTGLFGAEPWSEELRNQIESKLHIDAYDTYGLSEIMGPGVSGECTEKNGLHINEDHFIAEVINPKTAEVLKHGEEGELVFTTITKEGFPLIRYRTGDIASLICEPCPCGRTFIKMTRITGRNDDLIFYKGLKIFPSQIEEILKEAEEIEPRFQIILNKENGLETLEIQIEVSEKISAFDEIKTLSKLKDKIKNMLSVSLNLDATIKLVEPKTIKIDSNKNYNIITKPNNTSF